MSTATLTSLLDYLYGTLTPNNMRWVGEHLIEQAKKEESEQLRPYSMEEIDNMLDEAEAAFEAGDYLTNDEVFHHQKERVTV
jgi:glutathione S-transferase